MFAWKSGDRSPVDAAPGVQEVEMPKAVEVTVVYDDGTVERWTGASADAQADCLAEGYGPTITKPLRKVTEVEGQFTNADSDGLRIGGDGSLRGSKTLDKLLPEEVDRSCVREGQEGRRFRFRIVVEAVPVEEAKP